MISGGNNNSDALGRRVSTTTREGTIRQHVYDGVQCVADIDGNGDVVASYTWGAGIDNLLAISVDTIIGLPRKVYEAVKCPSE